MRGARLRSGIPRGSQGRRKGRRHGDRFDYQDEREFQRADRGYHRSFGDRERYRQIFRDGYAAGYSDAFGRTLGYPATMAGIGRLPREVRIGQQGPYPARRRYGPGIYRNGLLTRRLRQRRERRIREGSGGCAEESQLRSAAALVVSLWRSSLRR